MTGGPEPAHRRAALATGTAIAAVIHYRPAILPVMVPMRMLATPSHSVIVIGTAPLAARYAAAAFRLGDLASIDQR